MRASSLLAISSVFVGASLSAAACTGQDPLPEPMTSDGGDTTPDSSSDVTPGDDGGGDSGKDGGATCPGDLADCDGDGTCETPLSISSEHCGACGRSCGLGGRCDAKQCQPIVLAANVSGAVAVAVNTTALVIQKSGGPGVCPKDGCGGAAPVSLANGEENPGAPHVLYVDESDAYWLGKVAGTSGNRFELRRCAIAGCGLAPTSIDESQLGNELRGDGGALLRYDPSGAVTKITLKPFQKQYFNVGTLPSSTHFALGEGMMAFSNHDGATGGNAGIWVGKFENVAPKRIMNAGDWVAIAGGSVYATRSVDALHDAIYACPFAGCGGVGTNFGGAGASSSMGKIADITADASGVYWVENTGNVGRVMACSLPACSNGPRVLAVAQQNPFAITTDDKFVYWVNAGLGGSTGSVSRVAK